MDGAKVKMKAQAGNNIREGGYFGGEHGAAATRLNKTVDWS